MKTRLDCIPCFFKQALTATRMAGFTEIQQKQIIDDFALTLPNISFSAAPPETTRKLYQLINQTCDNKDIFAAIKNKSNRMVLDIYEQLKAMIVNENDSLLMAVELAIAGNIIDFGVKSSLNIEDELNRILANGKNSSEKTNRKNFDYQDFQKVLDRASNIVFLGDNAGEIVFDRLLIEEILNRYPDKNIIYAVKEKPIINDALAADARQCGIDKIAAIVSSGSDAPGTVLSVCSNEFIQLYDTADMIISKGQGNFEALSANSRGRDIFFLFMAKCQVVADHIQGKIRDIILRYHHD